MLLSHHTFLFWASLWQPAVYWCSQTTPHFSCPTYTCLPLGFCSSAMWDNWGSLLSRSWACANLEVLRNSLIVLGQPWTNGNWKPVDKSHPHGMGAEVPSTLFLSRFQWEWTPFTQSTYQLSDKPLDWLSLFPIPSFLFPGITIQNKLPTYKPLPQALLLRGI